MLAATYKYLQYNNSCNQMLFAADHKGSRTCSVLLRYFLNFFVACDLYYIILYYIRKLVCILAKIMKKHFSINFTCNKI